MFYLTAINSIFDAQVCVWSNNNKFYGQKITIAFWVADGGLPASCITGGITDGAMALPWIRSPKEGGAEDGEGGGGEDARDGVAQPQDRLLLVVRPAEIRVPVGQVDEQGLPPLDQFSRRPRKLGRPSSCEEERRVWGGRVTSCRQLVKLLQDRVHVVMRRLSRLFPSLLLRAEDLHFRN